MHREFWWGNRTERDHLEDPGIDWKIILNCVFKEWDVGMDWIDLAQGGGRWRAVVNAATNLGVP